MGTPLRVLILEDNPFDAELVLRELSRGGYAPDWRRVDNEADFLSSLSPDYDIILSDYDMSSFNAARALELLKDSGHDIPFIIISGTIGEDVAVQVMKLGATDYLLKDRLIKLGIAVGHAMDQAQLRRERARAAVALQKSEQELRKLTAELEIEKARLSAAQAVAKMGSWDTDLATMAVIWSPETYHIFELTPEAFQPTHQGFLQLVHPEDRKAVEQAFILSLKERLISSIEHRLLMADGRIKYVEEHWQVFHDNDGRPLRALGTCRDITTRKLAAEELRWKTAFLEAQVSATIDGIIVVDQQGRQILQNQRMAELFGIPPHIAADPDDSAQLQWVTDMVVDSQGFVERVGHLYAHPHEISRDEIDLKNGTVLDRYSSPVIGNDGRYYGRIWAFRDITERKNAALALLHSKRFLQSTLNALTSHIAILDEKGSIIEVNAAWERFATDNGFQGPAMGVGDNYLALCDYSFGQDSQEALRVAEGIRAVMAGERQEFHLEYPCHSPDLQRWFVVRVTRFDGGGPLRVVVAHENITERKNVEQALRESEERFRQLAENIHEVFWSADVVTGATLYISPGFQAIWGRTCESLYASPATWSEAIHPEDKQRVIEALQKQKEGTYDEEYRILRPDGSLRWVRDRAFPVRNEHGTIYRMVGVAHDITERKQSQDQLREQASLLDKARDAILVRDLEGRITYWNKGAEQVYGWTSAEALGRKIAELVYDDPAPFQEATAAAIQRGEWAGDLQQVTKDGASILVEARWTLVRDAGGQPQSILAINTDITEKRKMEQQFLRAQRLENIGTLAGGIAHDLNNVLAPILMSIGLLRLTSVDSRSKAVLTTIETSAKRGADMVRQILSFARGVEGQRAPLNISTVIDDIQHLFQETFPKNIQLQCEVSPDLPTVLADQTQLHQVLLNLCVNARDVMPAGGTLSISAVSTTVDELTATSHPHATPGPHVLIKVTDSGSGMPPEVMEKIFDPFFTTKEVGKGTGLGLSTVMTIVKSHGGFLDVNSKPGHGTTFSIYLPTSGATTETTAELPGNTLPLGKGELILVVDDEVAVRTVTQQTLEAFGYHALLAADGTEALSLYAAHRGEVAAVITDLMMPVMDGSMTIQVLRRINPDVKIIAGSGVATDGTSAHMAELKVSKFLPKPYSTQSLLTTLREVLDA